MSVINLYSNLQKPYQNVTAEELVAENLTIDVVESISTLAEVQATVTEETIVNQSIITDSDTQSYNYIQSPIIVTKPCGQITVTSLPSVPIGDHLTFGIEYSGLTETSFVMLVIDGDDDGGASLLDYYLLTVNNGSFVVLMKNNSGILVPINRVIVQYWIWAA